MAPRTLKLPLPVKGYCLCVCNQSAFADNCTDAVDRLLISWNVCGDLEYLYIKSKKRQVGSHQRQVTFFSMGYTVTWWKNPTLYASEGEWCIPNQLSQMDPTWYCQGQFYGLLVLVLQVERPCISRIWEILPIPIFPVEIPPIPPIPPFPVSTHSALGRKIGMGGKSEWTGLAEFLPEKAELGWIWQILDNTRKDSNQMPCILTVCYWLTEVTFVLFLLVAWELSDELQLFDSWQ